MLNREKKSKIFENRIYTVIYLNKWKNNSNDKEDQY